MRIAVYAGTFDPITIGHASVLERASLVFDRIIVLVAVNPDKAPLFSVEERLAMITETTAHLANVEAASTEGFVVDFARACGARFLVRGVRTSTDVDSEIALANLNHALAPDIATVFLPAQPGLGEVSSSRLKELVRAGCDVSAYAIPSIVRRIQERIGSARVTQDGDRHE